VQLVHDLSRSEISHPTFPTLQQGQATVERFFASERPDFHCSFMLAMVAQLASLMKSIVARLQQRRAQAIVFFVAPHHDDAGWYNL
jgi:hypothetical protein